MNQTQSQALTANRLDDGEVVFLSRGQWVGRFPAADLYTDPKAAARALEEAKSFAPDLIEPYLIDVRLDGDAPVPVSYRERVRALGPTIHPEMGKQAEGGPIIAAIQKAAGAGRSSSGRLGLIRRK